MIKKKDLGFSLLEIIIVIAIFSILATVSMSDFVSSKKTSDLNNNVKEFVSTIKLAQSKTVSSENYSQYGVYINTSVSPNQYTLFKGATYTSDPSSYQVYSLQNTMEFNDVSLGGGNEIVFDKLNGASQESGSISIRIKNDATKSKTVYITSLGSVSLSPPPDYLDDNRVKDSRHMHFSYGRVVDSATENITLTFNNDQTMVIPINAFLSSGELDWSDSVVVDGVEQVLEIRTHRLNNPDTLFSIHRDRRYNDKTLDVEISGDTSGYLIRYSADGTTTSYSSANVSDLLEQ